MSLHKLTPEKVSWIIGLGKAAAQAFLEFHHPEVTADEIERIVSQARALQATSYPYAVDNTARNHFIAAVWLCGASYREIGKLFGVQRQTISDITNRELKYISATERAGLRLDTKLSMEKLGAMYEFYNTLDSHAKTKQLLKLTDPVTLSRMLVDIPITESEHSAYDQNDPQTTLHKTEEAQPERSASVATTVQPMTAENFWDKVKMP